MKFESNSSLLTMPIYRASSEEDRDKLLNILDSHVPALRDHGLITSSPAFLVRTQQGDFMEIFVWKNSDAVKAAHEHPVISVLWEELGAVCQFLTLGQLEESGEPFPDFEVVRVY